MNLKEYQEELLQIFRDINELFILNKIKWFAHSGTLLGAIRHKGFIPWDDDIDMMMELDFFYENEAFLKKLVNSKFKNYILLSPFQRPNRSDCCRIISKKFFEISKGNKIFPFIDIMLFTNKEVKNLKKISNISKLNGSFAYANCLFKIEPISKILNIIYEKRFVKLQKKIVLLPKNDNFKSCKLVYWCSMRGEVYDISEYVETKFSSTLMPIPKNYLNVLENSFGKNFMDIPPKEKQISHHIDLKSSIRSGIDYNKVLSFFENYDAIF